MGRWATYIVNQEPADPPAAYLQHGGTVDTWSWWELPIPRGTDWDPGDGSAIIAYVYGSDAVMIHGLRDRRQHWTWTFGESALAGYEFREVDGMELEETLPARAAETADELATWATMAGLPGIDPTALSKVLRGHDLFAENSFYDLMTAVGLVSETSPVESRELVPTVLR